MDDVEVGDCTSDGTCDDGDAGAPTEPIMGVKAANTTLLEETTAAIQQFSIVIGVALLVFALFGLMVAVDKTIDFLGEKFTSCCGKKAKKPEADPADLVGSFKRYKN